MELTDGQIRRCHQDKVRILTIDVTPESTSERVTAPPMIDLEPSVIPTQSSSNSVTTDPQSDLPSLVELPILLLRTILQLRLYTPATTISTQPKNYPKRNLTTW